MARIAALISGLSMVAVLSLQGFAEAPSQEIQEFNLTGYDEKANKSWQLKAHSAEILQEKVHLKGVDAYVYTENEKINISSCYGTYYKTENKIRLKEDVLVTTDTGMSLSTETLEYLVEPKVVFTEDPVKIEREGFQIKAQGLEGKPDLKKIYLKRNPVVKINKSDRTKTTITCKGPLDIDYERNIAIFKDNVVATDKEAKIFANEMKIYFNPSSQSIERIKAYGDVRIIRDQNITYSQKAEYSVEDKKLILTGNPKVIIYTKESENASVRD